ncbi:MAG: DUF1272 domain-containing protein [Gammaproteobacteria bacterium]|nr:DUF1272 domain-containing protein [Gammaproteobacteria bacterium]
MLDVRPNCERCDKDLAADQPGAMICSFECTFCTDCADAMNSTCPNCGGELVPRPTRVASLWPKFPPSQDRKFKPKHKETAGGG